MPGGAGPGAGDAFAIVGRKAGAAAGVLEGPGAGCGWQASAAHTPVASRSRGFNSNVPRER
jgi:hypothetical protein